MRRALPLAAALLGAGCSGPAPQPKPTPDFAAAACAAATVFAEREIGQNEGHLVFAIDGGSMGLPEGPGPGAFERFEWADPATGKDIAPPPVELMAALHKSESQSAVAKCPALRAMLDARKIGYGEAAVARAGEQGWAIVSLSMPAASETVAVLATSHKSGEIYSDGSLFYLRRDAKGVWGVAGVSPLDHLTA